MSGRAALGSRQIRIDIGHPAGLVRSGALRKSLSTADHGGCGERDNQLVGHLHLRSRRMSQAEARQLVAQDTSRLSANGDIRGLPCRP